VARKYGPARHLHCPAGCSATTAAACTCTKASEGAANRCSFGEGTYANPPRQARGTSRAVKHAPSFWPSPTRHQQATAALCRARSAVTWVSQGQPLRRRRIPLSGSQPAAKRLEFTQAVRPLAKSLPGLQRPAAWPARRHSPADRPGRGPIDQDLFELTSRASGRGSHRAVSLEAGPGGFLYGR